MNTRLCVRWIAVTVVACGCRAPLLSEQPGTDASADSVSASDGPDSGPQAGADVPEVAVDAATEVASEVAADSQDSAADLTDGVADQSEAGGDASDGAADAPPTPPDAAETQSDVAQPDGGTAETAVDLAETSADLPETATGEQNGAADAADTGPDSADTGPDSADAGPDSGDTDLDAAGTPPDSADAAADAGDAGPELPPDVAPDAAGADSGCVASACNDGNDCTADSCGAAGCAHAAVAGTCDDGTVCTTNVCAAGTCQATTVSCDDGNACTVDSCDAAKGCQHAPLPCPKPACTQDADCPGGACDPNLHACVACLSDKGCPADKPLCSAGQCSAGTLCSNDTPCKATQQVCDKGVGHCVDCLSAADCSPTQVCSKNVCVAKVACTSNKPCAAVCAVSLGYCVACNVSSDCDASQYCDGDHTCQPKVCSAGKCLGGQFLGCKADGTGYLAPVNCVDGKACKQDLCEPNQGCSHPPVNDGSACDDGKGCPGDLCKAGACVGVPLALEATFGSVPYATADRLAVSEDGGFVGIGRAKQTPTAPLNAWAFKLDAQGKLLWEVHYPAGEKTLDGVASDGAGGLYAVGYEPGSALAIHLDAAGKTVWKKNIGDKAGQMKAVVVMADKSLVVGGTSDAAGAMAPTLWRIAADGSLLATFLPPAPTSDASGQLVDVALTQNGNLAVAGGRYQFQKQSGNPAMHAWIAIVKGDLKAVVAEAFVDASNATFSSLAALPTGALATLRGSAQGAAIQLFDAGLQSLWTTTAPGVQAGAVVATPTGQLGYVGQAYSLKMPALGPFDGVFIALHPATGNILANYQFGYPGADSFIGGVGTADGFALHGYASAPGNVRRAWLVRPDASGNTACACIGAGKSEVCDDSNPCTLDSCDPTAGCKHATAVDGVACDDGSPISAALACKAGKCLGCNQASVTPVANTTHVSLMAVAPDGSLRVEAYNTFTSASHLVRIDEGGKIAWDKLYSAFTSAGGAQHYAVRADGATAVLVYENGPWKHYGFLVDGTPMTPPSTPAFGLAPLAVQWTADGKLAELVYDPSGEELREYVRPWGVQPTAAAWTLGVQKFAGTGSIDAVPSLGPAAGELTLCYRSGSAVGTASFVRRNGTNGAWSAPTSVSVSGNALCMPSAIATGVVVANQVDGIVKQILRFDGNGMAAWVATEPWIGSARGFVQAGENLYAWGQADTFSPWQVWRLDGGGKVAASAALGKPTSFSVALAVVTARAVGNAIVLGGYTQFTATPKLGYEYPIRAQADLNPAFVCLP